MLLKQQDNCFPLWADIGTPTETLSDRGPEFVNELIVAVLKAVGTRHVMSLAYSKEENGRVERANRETLRHLRAFVGHSKVVYDWVLKLQRIMNASVHSVPKFAPADLLFGKAINLNANILPKEGDINGNDSSAFSWSSIDIESEFYSTRLIHGMRHNNRCYEHLLIYNERLHWNTYKAFRQKS